MAKQKPAYLLPNFGPGELVFNMEGKVKGGTLPALIERLTQHDTVDTEFLNSFLLTYKSFTTAEIILNIIIQRFYVTPPPDLTEEQIAEFNEKKLMPIRLRVTNVLKTWLETYYEDFAQAALFKKLSDFVSGDLKLHLKNPAEQILKLIQKKLTGTLSRKMVFSGQAPLPIVSKSLSATKLKFVELDPLEIARQVPPPLIPFCLINSKKTHTLCFHFLSDQLTLMESKIFNSIDPAEFLGKSWSTADGETRSLHIMLLIERANRVSQQAFIHSSSLEKLFFSFSFIFFF